MSARFFVFLLSVFVIFLILFFLLYNFFSISYPAVAPQLLWPIQCIDTMKVSRDRARELAHHPFLDEIIHKQVKVISSIGATCISVGTPYDDEFIPYLSAWVRHARAEGLSVWFRGNFAGWEGWFDYPRIRDTDEYLAKLRLFLVTHQDLFMDGDIFTAAPEAEHGGPFRPGDVSLAHSYRSFLVQTYRLCSSFFADVGKNVICNLLSMSGGQAKVIFTESFAREVGNVVTLDHYVRDVADMASYIHYFSHNFGSRVVLGEFGAPIPDLNGAMSASQQRDFVAELLRQLYIHRDVIVGVNYWTLTEGSTSLLDSDGGERPVVQVLRDYYQPGVIVGKVVHSWGMGVPFARIHISVLPHPISTDQYGYFVLYVPAGYFKLTAFTDQRTSQDYFVEVSRHSVSKVIIYFP